MRVCPYEVHKENRNRVPPIFNLHIGDECSAICLGLFALEVPVEHGAGLVSQRVWMFWRIFLPLSGEEPRSSSQLCDHSTNCVVLASIRNNLLIFSYHQ